MHRRNAESTALPHNLRSEIDLIVRRPNAGAELDNQIGSARTKVLRHRFNGIRDDTKLRPLLPRMHQANRIAHRIDQINRAAIGDVDAKANAALICDEAIATFKTFVPGDAGIDNSNSISVNLLCGSKRHGGEPMPAEDLPMNAIQPRERFRLVVGHLDPGHAQGETMSDLRQSAERRKSFSRKLIFVHLLPVVVRVVRVVVLIWAGGRLPARFNSSGLGFGAGVGRASVLNLFRVKGSSSSFE